MEVQIKFPMFAKGLTEEQIANRKILRTAMEKAGFTYYPGEWWHYCYGDQMWAAYMRKKYAVYGTAV
jgi:D-alanyl-D-alanine dipeptidase